MSWFYRSLLLPVFGFLLFLAACSSEEEDPLEVPANYDGANFENNASTELAVLQQLKSFRDEAFKGRTNGVEVSGTSLNVLYVSGSPSLKSLTTPYYAGRLEGDNGYMNQLALASGNTYTLGDTEGEGGTFGEGSSTYLFDENGVELEQLLEKGMFGAALYNHALTLLNGTLDNTTSDKVLAIYGSHPTFPNSTDGTKHTNPDRYAASYTARRDKNDGNGFYSNIRYNLIRLQAAVKAGDDYKTDQQNAVKAIKENWEKANAATVINYLNATISKLSETNPSDAVKAGALHEISESIGFIRGWKTIAQEQKIISDSQIETLLALLKDPENGTPSVYQFALHPENELADIEEVINTLKTIYGFSNEQMEDFKKNWVSVQGR